MPEMPSPQALPLTHVGINALFMTPEPSGMGTWTRELPGALRTAAPELRLTMYAKPETIESLRHTEPWADEVHFVAAPRSPRGERATRIAAEMTWLPLRLHNDGVQLLHSVANVAPVFCPVPQVLTLHDLLFRHFPSTHPGFSGPVLRVLTPLMARAATRIATPSQASRDDLVRSLGLPPGKIRVIPQGHGFSSRSMVEVAEVRRRLNLGNRRVVLTLGVGFEHKNVGRLVEAFARVGPQRDAVLVHVGHPLFEAEGWAMRAQELDIADHTRWPSLDGFVDGETLEGLFATASMLVHPALLEGFGFPLLEAMTRGVPVASSSAASLPEVGGDAVEYFNPTDIDAMATAIARLLDDPQHAQELARRGHEQAARFTWERNAREYAALYREAYASKAPR